MYYYFPKETWDTKKCAKLARHRRRDGLGTPYPFRGYLGSSASMPPFFGKIRYNGGCTHGDTHYEGEVRPFPNIPEEFVIVVVPTWGWRIRRVDDLGSYDGTPVDTAQWDEPTS